MAEQYEEGFIIRTPNDELQHWSEVCIREKARSHLEMWCVWNTRDKEMQNWPVREKIPKNWRILFSTREPEPAQMHTLAEVLAANEAYNEEWKNEDE